MHKKPKYGVLLLNLGTPKSPSVWNVAKYLKQFLNDPRVIDIHPIARFFLVNGIIVPFRSPQSARAYQKLWTREGSPLLFYGKELSKKLQDSLGQDFGVHLAMRYQEPSIPKVLKEMEKMSYQKIIIFPLFPQYASSTTGSALEETLKHLSRWYVIPEFCVISQYFDNRYFIDAWVELGKKYLENQAYDHVLFSYHGLPIRQLNKVYQDGKLCEEHFCKKEWNEQNFYCYEAACYETTRKIVHSLNIQNYTVAFQSRLGKDAWIQPYAEPTIIDLAQRGIKKLLVFSPAFVADCLETLIEIGHEYAEIFQEHGGVELTLVHSLNAESPWVDAIKNMILERI
ncbi:MAG: ferrochelatase [Bacteroidia bacterium]|nr:MAG: ferrochelatase [Bacteroidia bacterium]